MRTRILGALAAPLVVLLAAAPFCMAQNYPARPVKIVVATSPGGTTDMLARALAQGLSESWGQPVVVENRPGANEIIGVSAVAKAPADGYTLAFSDCAAYVINPNLHKNLPYDSVRDFSPVITLARPSPVLVAGPTLAANNFRELIALAKSAPGTLSYGSFGNGSYPHISMENLKRLTGVDIAHVPFKGSSPALTALLSGQISLMLVNLGNVDAHVKSGKLKLLAAATSKRLALVPNLPTIAESGLPGFEASTWWGMLAPAGTPREVIAKINADSNRILSSQAFSDKYLARNGLEPVGNTPEQAAELIKSDLVHWAALVKASGAQID
jgi:tripartite-type tricarboxylate transporter receptor subunit TctC